MIHKTTRSILSVLLAVLLLVASIPLTPAFAGGGGAVSLQSESAEGRALEPVNGEYQISTAAELREFAKLVNGGKTDADAILTANIDLNPNMEISEDGTVTNGSDLDQWTPIGNSSQQYSGTFDGDGHTISGLYINSSDNDQGLFGYVSGSGKVQNLSVSGSVKGNDYVGGVVGYNNGGTVTGCIFSGSGSVSGDWYVGGVVGHNGFSATVTNCYNTGTVTGTGYFVGGVVGGNYLDGASSVENCYNTGSVSGNSYVGGVVGDNRRTVENCYNTGTVTGNSYVGGVVGYSSGGISASASVTNCYNTGRVSGNSYVGGVVGQNSSSSVTNCYFLQQNGVPAQGIGSGSGSATPLSAEAFESQKSFTSWDFGNTWKIEPIFGRPTLQANAEIGGTANNPYKIFTATQLKTFRDIVNGASGQVKDSDAHAKLMENIDLNPGITFNADGTYSSPARVDPQEWTPIGTSSSRYTGTFDGDGHTISGLYIDSSDNNQGLFGYVSGSGKIEKLSVSGSVKGHSSVGGVVGYNFSGTVTNCAFSGSVGGIFSGSYVGGIVGYNSSGTVTNCAFSGSVSGNYVGGVVGQNSSSGTVKNCHNIGTGTVSGSDHVGGVVGSNNNGSVENCYNTGSVKGSGNSVGGVVGYNQSGSSVTTCYNTGTVSGSDYVGGVVGENSGSNGVVENCHNAGKVSGRYVGGVVGSNSGTVENCYNTDSVSNGTTSGGVVGQNSGSGSVTGCYFLQQNGVPAQGIGSGTGTATEKDDTAFHSGEVAWLLENGQTDGSSQVWGQSNLKDKNSWPTLIALDKNAKTVYKVITDYGYVEQSNNVSYTNNPAEPAAPSREGYTFGGWQKTTGEGNTITYTAKWTAEEPPYTGRYSYEITTDTSDNGTLSVDRYATEGDKVTIDVTPDQAYKLDELVVTANGKDVELTANSDGTYTFTMPSADVKITATFAEDPDWTEPEEPATDVSDIFLDVAPNAWYKDAVQYAYDHGLMTGVSATEFAPEATTTRAMIVSILARLENVTTAEAAGFADVTDEWYATAVNWAANVGVVNGYEDNTFQPNTAITREQLAAILMNYAAYKGEDVSARADLSAYTDQPSTWATDTMSWAVAEGLISGVTNDELRPQGNATRAQVAAILQRLLEA